jgi:hypothetical protein
MLRLTRNVIAVVESGPHWPLPRPPKWPTSHQHGNNVDAKGKLRQRVHINIDNIPVRFLISRESIASLRLATQLLTDSSISNALGFSAP